MLAVDGQKLAARIPDGLHQKTAAADDALLVGKKKALARASGRKGGRNARGADHGLHDDVRVGIIREAGDGLRGRRAHLDVAEPTVQRACSSSTTFEASAMTARFGRAERQTSTSGSTREPPATA